MTKKQLREQDYGDSYRNAYSELLKGLDELLKVEIK